MKKIAIIVAAGEGKRFGSFKQTKDLNGKPLFSHSLDVFHNSRKFESIFIVVHKEILQEVKSYLDSKDYKNITICEGGPTRAVSVKNAFKMIKDRKSKIFIHDAARPLINSRLIDELIVSSKDKDILVVAKKINDTVKKVEKNKVKSTIDRSNLWTSETPQIFSYDKLESIYNKLGSKFLEHTDEASMAESFEEVSIFENKDANIKVTDKRDIDLISKIQTSQKVGIGIDFHTLVEGNGLTAGGYKISCPYQSRAHSDGDVLTHSIIDALCGALSLGDIGEHFPNTDEFLNISSIELLKTIVKKAPVNFTIINLDASIVLNNPKISQYKEAITKSVAKALNISEKIISIKATTSNGLKFVDMKNGWGAEVIITIKVWS